MRGAVAAKRLLLNLLAGVLMAVLAFSCQTAGVKKEDALKQALTLLAKASDKTKERVREYFLEKKLYKALAVDPDNLKESWRAWNYRTQNKAIERAKHNLFYVLFAKGNTIVWETELEKYRNTPFGAGQKHLGDKEYEEALRQFEKHLAQNSDGWEVRNRLGWANFYLGRYETALQQFNKSHSFNSEAWGTVEGILLCTACLGQKSEALAYYKKNREKLSKMGDWWTAAFYLALDAYEKAHEIFGNKGFVGISYDIKEMLDGALVAHVFKNSPADLAGIKSGDILLEVDGSPVSKWKKAFEGTTYGKWIRVKIKRDGQILEGKVHMGITPDLKALYQRNQENKIAVKIPEAKPAAQPETASLPVQKPQKPAPAPAQPAVQPAAQPAVQSRETDRSQPPPPEPDIKITGTFHALVIGNNNYIHFPGLNTAVADAVSVSDLLKNQYGFTVTRIIDGTREAIIGALDDLRAKLENDDSLVIYYAGHGWMDVDIERGYWLPVDASDTNTAKWISNADITDKLKSFQSCHVLVIADSCYSGTLTRSIKPNIKFSNYLEKMMKKRSRTVLTSGGMEPVLDGGGSGHSIFAKALITTLGENRGVMVATDMFSKIRKMVMLNADQTPQYSDIRFAGHEGGDFLFIRKP